MSGFPGPQSYSEFLAAQANIARNSDAFRDTCEGQRHATGASFDIEPFIARTPDADDVADALHFKAEHLRAKDHRLSALLQSGHRRIRELEHEIARCVRQIRALEALNRINAKFVQELKEKACRSTHGPKAQ